MRPIPIFVICLALALPFGAARAAPEPVDAAAIRSALEGPARSFDALPERPALQRLYAALGFQPAWLDGARLSLRGQQALERMRTSNADGLDPMDYGVDGLEARLGSAAADAALSAELNITAALLRYFKDLSQGRVTGWAAGAVPREPDAETDPAEFLAEALAAPDFANALAVAAPPHAGYASLRSALSDLRAVQRAGGWPQVPDGPALHPGDRGARVAALRRRLAATDGAPIDTADDLVFDAALEAAVRRTQRRHGLEPDGIVGRATLAALNRPVEDRIDQIVLNLERWRWLPRDLGDPYVIVNAGGQELSVVENGVARLSMPVIVGRSYRRTPLFNGRITHLILNPDWVVPTRIARLDLLPKIKQDPTYLSRERFEVYESWAPGARRLDPAAIDWAGESAANFSFKLRQLPGPTNALGRIKFVLPNPYDVFLHDTPTRALFDRAERLFSSGCIRLAAPLALADFLMQGAPDWSATRDSVLAGGETLRMDLPRPVAVHLTYFTAWLDNGGTLHLHADAYGRDRELEEALFGVKVAAAERREEGSCRAA